MRLNTHAHPLAVAIGPRPPLLLAVFVLGLSACFDDDASPPGVVVQTGADALVETRAVLPGPECPEGGVEVRAGVDRDGDGALHDDELTDDPVILCHGADGPTGPPGEDGDRGPPGADAGAPPRALVRTTALPDGDPACPGGGVRIEVGIDVDGSGDLDDDEVSADQTQVLCDGLDSPDAGTDGHNAAFRVELLDPGSECPQGGVLVQAGIDANDNGALDPEEVDDDQQFTLCHGTDGAPGLPGDDGLPGTDGDAGPPGQGAVLGFEQVTSAPGCPAGGVRIDVGLDANGNLVLDPEEVDPGASVYVCNGVDGDDASDAGTGLQLGDVLFGNVSVENTIDLALLQGYRKVAGSLTVDSQSLVSVSLPALEEVTGDLVLDGEALEVVSLPALTRVGGELIVDDTSLIDLDGLPALEELGGGLQVTGNNQLVSVPSLEGLTLIGGDIEIYENNDLPTCAAYAVIRTAAETHDEDPNIQGADLALYGSQVFDRSRCVEACADPGSLSCDDEALCIDDQGADVCRCGADYVGDGETCAPVDPGAPWGSADRPVVDCRDLRERDPSATSGLYFIRPTSSALPFEVYCEQDVAGGGWTRLTADTVRWMAPESLEQRRYLFAKSGAWIASPYTDQVWSWSTGAVLPGLWTAANASGFVTLPCPSPDATVLAGVGCGQTGFGAAYVGDPGGGAVVDPDNGTATVCQGQPTVLDAESCTSDVEVYVRRAHAFTPHRYRACDAAACPDDGSLCMKAGLGIAFDEVPVFASVCDAGAGFVSQGGGCYYVVDPESPRRWRDARAACAQAGGYLAVADSVEEEDVLRALAPGTLPLGVCDLDVEDGLTAVHGGLAPHTRFNLSSSGTVAALDCLTLTGTGWAMAPCTNTFGEYVCEFDAAPAGAVVDGAGGATTEGGSFSATPSGPLESLEDLNAFTFEAWIHRTSAEIMPLIEHGWLLRLLAGGTVLTFASGGTGAISVAVNAPLHTWTHLALTFDGSTVTAYVNGVQSGSAALTADMRLREGPLFLGRCISDAYNCTRDFADARFDEVRLWGGARSAASIAADYDRTLDPALSPGLVASWTFDMAPGDGRVPDVAGPHDLTFYVGAELEVSDAPVTP